MSTNLRAAAAALALAGGVYLACPAPVEASNMGFKLERSFDLIRRTADNRPLQNIYWISNPLFNGLGDIANTADPANNKCVEPGGAGAPDGIINSDDAICDFWTARTNPATAGTFTFSYIDRDTCTPIARNGTVQLGQIRFTGVAFPMIAEIGYQALVTVPGGATYSPQNRAVIVGSHDPSFAGRSIIYATACGASAPRLDLLNLPYHTMYTSSFEILCGLEGVDWVDANADGRPDTCTAGIFDGTRAMTVSFFANREPENAPVSHNVTFSLGQVRFTGTPFSLVPGDGYLIQISPGHTPTTWLSPHY